MTTALHPLITAQLRKNSQPLRERIMAWRFFNVHGIETTTYEGKPVSIHGEKFSGSTRDLFWSGFFEPFIVAAAKDTFSWVVEHCKANNLEPDEFIDEAKNLSQQLTAKALSDIAETDQLLRGNGFPASVQRQNVTGKTAAIREHLERLATAFKHRGPTASKEREDVFDVKPNFYGIGINLNALWRKIWRRKP